MAGFFGFFDYTKPGPGVRKDEPEKTGLALYFDIFLRRFWKFLSLNIIHIIGSLISLGVLWFVSSFSLTWLSAVLGINIGSLTTDETTAIFMLAVCVVLVLSGMFGTGAPTAASAYVIRNYVNDSHSWVLSDYVEHLKKNFVQGTIVFVIDVIVYCLFLISMVYYTFETSGLLFVFVRTVLCIVFLIYMMMHMYIYQIMAKFKMKLKDIYKSSAILVMIKLPWNVLAFIVSALITYGVLYLFMTSVIPGIILALVLYFSINMFTQIFMTNNIVRKYMLEPSLEMERKAKKDTPEDE